MILVVPITAIFPGGEFMISLSSRPGKAILDTKMLLNASGDVVRALPRFSAQWDYCEDCSSPGPTRVVCRPHAGYGLRDPYHRVHICQRCLDSISQCRP